MLFTPQNRIPILTMVPELLAIEIFKFTTWGGGGLYRTHETISHDIWAYKVSRKSINNLKSFESLKFWYWSLTSAWGFVGTLILKRVLGTLPPPHHVTYSWLISNGCIPPCNERKKETFQGLFEGFLYNPNLEIYI